MKLIWKLAFISLFYITASFSAFAVNYSFMSNSAMSYFTKDDWAIFNETQEDVLNNGRADVTVTWSNPKSGSHGSMTPSQVNRINGLICRTVKFVNVANLVQGEGVYTFCKKNNEWKIY